MSCARGASRAGGERPACAGSAAARDTGTAWETTLVLLWQHTEMFFFLLKTQSLSVAEVGTAPGPAAPRCDVPPLRLLPRRLHRSAHGSGGGCCKAKRICFKEVWDLPVFKVLVINTEIN